MKWLRIILMGLVLTIFTGTLEGCKKNPSRTYKGKIKKGKPIPCPVKDC